VKRIGPELKMPKLKGSEIKVPPFLSDLYFDLRDRRLLPLVALMLVAIVATPFLLKSDSAPIEPVPPPTAGNEGAEQSAARTLTVVKAEPGLRDYKQRLSRRAPKNPFKQRYTAPVLAGAELNPQTTTTTSAEDGSSGGGSSGGGSVVPGQPSTAGGGSSGGEDADDNGVPDSAALITYVVDLQVTKIQTEADGTRQKTGPKRHEDVKAPAPLPGEKTPVVTYLGLGAKEPRLPMFLVSSEVTAIFGEGDCIAGTGTCELIALRRGFPVTFVYGENDVRYKINLLDITGVPVDPPK
jgi:hypothetical protein